LAHLTTKLHNFCRVWYTGSPILNICIYVTRQYYRNAYLREIWNCFFHAQAIFQSQSLYINWSKSKKQTNKQKKQKNKSRDLHSQMSKHVSYETIFIWYGIRLQVNVVPQCRNTLQYVVSYVKCLEDFTQTKYCSSNEKKIQIFVEYDTLGRIYKFETNRCKLAWLWATNVSSHNFRKKRCYILWWLFEELLKVFTWLVGFRYQLSIISVVSNL
jgi:hypothetical protein